MRRTNAGTRSRSESCTAPRRKRFQTRSNASAGVTAYAISAKRLDARLKMSNPAVTVSKAMPAA